MINESAIPAELKQYPHWVIWRKEKDDKGKLTKRPYVVGTTAWAKVDKSETWHTFQAAFDDYKSGRWGEGIGFVFTDTPYTGIDCDHCLHDGKIIDKVVSLFVTTLDSYTEESCGEDGLHIIIKGELPWDNHILNRPDGVKIELYDSGRYFTFTGRHWEGTPENIEDRQEQLEWLYEGFFSKDSKEVTRPGRKEPIPVELSDQELLKTACEANDDGKFAALWQGDISGYPSQSEADQAFCDKLAFWTGGDAARMDQLFRQSGLFREKWDKKHFGDGRTYGEGTIAKAIDYVTEFYSVDKQSRPIGGRLSPKVIKQLGTLPISCPSPDLRNEVLAALLETTTNPKTGSRKLRPIQLRRIRAGQLLLNWLCDNGGFVQSEEEEPYYFYRHTKRLYHLDSNHWAAWLYGLSGANPAGTDYAYLQADCKTKAIEAPKREIVRVAAWDDNKGVLRVSRFDGVVYVLDGEEIAEEPNGENTIFDDSPLWLPYNPNFDGGNNTALRWHTTDLPNWNTERKSMTKEVWGLSLRAWILGSFFPELCPTKPMLVMVGEKGGGKTMTLRILQKFLYGPLAEVSGVPDKPDGFTAAAAVAHTLVLDNLDEFHGWLRDKLARLSTGGTDEYRRLYTSNEVGRVRYRCWLAFTSRTPDTLRRDDLADRLVILPVNRIDQQFLKAERDFLAQANTIRSYWWGDILVALNQTVAGIRRGNLKSQSKLRMADWESLGRVGAQAENKESLWETFIDDLQTAQAAFLLEGDLIVEGLQLWLTDSLNYGREVTAQELRQELTGRLFGDRSPPADWPKSAVGFGKRLAGIRRELKAHFRTEWGKGTAGKAHERTVYRFWPQEG